MRITQNTVVRGYLSNLERNYYNKNKSEQKISSNRKFSRASESPVDAARALKVRKALANLETYSANLDTANNIYSTAESAVMSISSLIQNTYEQLIYGSNATQGDEENRIIADTIDTYADEMVRLMNLTVADRKIFGGINNTSNCYAIESGKVSYNGMSVNAFDDATLFPQSSSSYTDIGIGMTIEADGKVDPQSALPITFNGAAILGSGCSSLSVGIDIASMTSGDIYRLDVTSGNSTKTISFTAADTAADTAEAINTELDLAFGMDNMKIDDKGELSSTSGYSVMAKNTEMVITDPTDPNYVDYKSATIDVKNNGYAKNIIQLTLDAAEALRSGDKKLTARYADLLFASQTTLSLSIADIGNREEFIEFNQERITNNIYSLDEQQNELEGTDYGTESTNWKVLESIYNATLQMSTSVLPMTIFDYMN